MNRINQLFATEEEKVLSVYFCAGDPFKEGVVKTIKALEKGGVKMVEIGIPFSDPMADGEVIQEASSRALRGGITLQDIFSQLERVREEVKIPLVMMGYLNPIMQFGFENFCQQCRLCGVDGVIIPDLPFRDYVEEYKAIADRHDIRLIMLITPETSPERVRLIDEHTDGFIYMVSSASVTGAQNSFDEEKRRYFKRIAEMNLRNPRMVGFGISNRQTLESAMQESRGAIVGSKFVSLLHELQDADKAVEALRKALQ